jgi:beta-N-acetylhexosaminidase
MLGPVLIDVEGFTLTPADRDRIVHPQTGGIIYFGRNYADPSQLKALSESIRALRPDILIAVDHEGGRVQRFRQGFTTIPAMRTLGRAYDEQPLTALATAQAIGTIIATELIAHGLDFSFAPVLDLDYGVSTVIGERALHGDPAKAALLAVALHTGFKSAGMNTVGKHFPGHGFVQADSHVATPVDERKLADIESTCMVPYPPMIAAGMGGIMPAHVSYTAVHNDPAGFSTYWLGRLRNELGFDGLIFSDDLTMEGASAAGDFTQRAWAAFAAGCDMVLLCNDGEGAARLLHGLAPRPIPPALARRQDAMRANLALARAAEAAQRYDVARARLDAHSARFAG